MAGVGLVAGSVTYMSAAGSTSTSRAKEGKGNTTSEKSAGGGDQPSPEGPPEVPIEESGRVTGDALKAARKEFNRVRPEFWKNEAKVNPGEYTLENLARREQGKAPIGSDGHPIELHHKTPLAEGGTNSFDNLQKVDENGTSPGPQLERESPKSALERGRE